MNDNPNMLPMDKVHSAVQGLGFERIQILPGSTYHDNSTVVVIPTRGMIHHRVVSAWQQLMAPMNQKRHMMFAVGHEVGRAYDAMISNILAHPDLSKWKYILTLEDDNLPPPDAHIRLLESIEWGKFDVMAGLYWTKGEYNMPMAYGDPEKFRATGELEFTPRDVREAVTRGNIMPVNGVAQGCTLYRMDLFRQIPPPWFVTVCDLTPTGPAGMTQDLHFSRLAVMAGKRLGVDLRVKVGHLDTNSDVVY